MLDKLVRGLPFTSTCFKCKHNVTNLWREKERQFSIYFLSKSVTSTWLWLANLYGWSNTQIKNSRGRRMRQLHSYYTLKSLTVRAFRKTNLHIMFYQCPCHFIIRHRNAIHADNMTAVDMTNYHTTLTSCPLTHYISHLNQNLTPLELRFINSPFTYYTNTSPLYLFVVCSA